jgi:hypothetical protein
MLAAPVNGWVNACQNRNVTSAQLEILLVKHGPDLFSWQSPPKVIGIVSLDGKVI